MRMPDRGIGRFLFVFAVAGCVLGATGAARAGGEIRNNDTGELFGTIQAAVDDADTLGGHTIEVLVPTHAEGPQIIISKSLTLIGGASNVVRPVGNTGSVGDPRGWFLVTDPAVDLTVRGLVFDGSGFLVYQAFRLRGGAASFFDCRFREIRFNESGPNYQGIGLAIFGTGPGTVVDCRFEGIGRIGTLFFGSGVAGSLFAGNVYTGKGDGDFLDYGVEFGAGATGVVRENVFRSNRGVASVDDSTSAGMLVSTFFGAGTQVTVFGNRFTDNTTGLFVGFDPADTSAVNAACNFFSGNGAGVRSTSNSVVTVARENFWGSASGPEDPDGVDEATPSMCFDPATMVNADGTGDGVSDLNVDYCPWKTVAPAAPGLGACLLGDGSCVDVTEETCDLIPGDYQGDGSGCVVVLGNLARPAFSEKGSLLFFSKVDLRWTDLGALTQDTFLSITNDYDANVRVKFYFINGDPPLAADPGTGERAHPGWNYVDNAITLTGDQPTAWSALTGQPAGVVPFTALDPGFPPGRPAPEGGRMLRGYVIAWAIDTSGAEIRWNHLSGTGTVLNWSDGYAWEYGSWNYRAVDPLVPHGDPTGTPGELAMDGNEYAPSFSRLLMDFQAVGSAAFSGAANVVSSSDVTLHPAVADLRQEGDGPVTTKAQYGVWNQNEVKFSETTDCVTCWDQTLLANFDPPNAFTLAVLQTPHGKAQIDGVASTQCDVDIVFGDGPLGAHPDDVISVDAPLLGLTTRFLEYDTGDRAASGVNLVGLGVDTTGVVRFDVSGGPPEANADPDFGQLFIDELLHDLRTWAPYDSSPTRP